MSQNDLLFLVVTLILSTTLITFIVQFVRSRRGRDSDDGGGNWWEGPWDEDDRR